MAAPGKWMVPARPLGQVVESSDRHLGMPVFTLSLDPDDICLPGELAEIETEREVRYSAVVQPVTTWVDLGFTLEPPVDTYR